MDTKICSRCKKEKEVTEFHKCSRNKDGYKYACKECLCLWFKDYYKQNKQYYRKHHSKYYQKHREQLNQYKRDYYRKNKDKLNENLSKWRKENIDKKREWERNYYHNNENRQTYLKEYAKKRREKAKE